MGTLNRKELDHLERRELQLTILAAVIVLVLAGGLAAFMYPLVFLHPRGAGCAECDAARSSTIA